MGARMVKNLTAASIAETKPGRKKPEKIFTPEINDRFRDALHIMGQTDASIFITGRAGTGKSTLLTYFRRTGAKRVVVLAPTGVAALNVGGQTIHNFFRFSIDVTPQKILKKK